jgi:hypothetical protein
VDGDEVIEYVGGEGALERSGRGSFAPEARPEGCGLGAAFAAALLEAVAVAVHLQDVDMVGEAIEQGSSEAFRAEDLGPLWNGKFEVTMVEPRS